VSDVVVLGIGACHCILVDAYEKKEIVVPTDMQRVKVWSSESEGGVGKDDYQYRMFKTFHPALLKENEKKVCKKFSLLRTFS